MMTFRKFAFSICLVCSTFYLTSALNATSIKSTEEIEVNDGPDEVPIDINQIPLDPNNPNYYVDVGVVMYMLDVEPYQGDNMDFRIDYYLRQVWRAPPDHCKHFFTDMEISERRKKIGKPVVLDHQKELLQIWLPDTFILNSKEEAFSSEVENLEALKLVMLNDTDCMLDYLLKMNARISCQLNYRFYPMDSQYCNLSLRSYTSDTSILKYHWIKPGEMDWANYTYVESRFAADGLVFLLPPRLSEYELYAKTNETVTFEYYNFSTLVLTLIYRRNLYDSFKGIYLPSSLVVWMSWISLWVHLDEIGRVLNNMTCFLALITQFTSLRGQLPAITYINGSDIWMLTCMIFVFLNLVQFTIVKYMQKYWNYDLSTRNESELNNFDIFEAQLNGYLMRKNQERLINTRRIQFISKSVGIENQSDWVGYLAPIRVKKFGSNTNLTNWNNSANAEPKAGLRFRRRAVLDENASQYTKMIQDKVKMKRDYENESSDESSLDSEEEEHWVKGEQRNRQVMLLIGKIDYWCRILFPAAYVIFNIIYWPIVYSPVFQ